MPHTETTQIKKLTNAGHTRVDLRGCVIVPMMTPFTASGDLDEDAVRRLVGHIIAGGCQGVLVAGTTGEFTSMPVAMRVRLVRRVIEAARGRLIVFAGIGDTSLAHSLELARESMAAGAHALVGNVPSYFPLTGTLMEGYFRNLADSVAAPLYIYNIPQTTRMSVPLDVVERLSAHPWIVGIKDSEPDAARQENIARMFAGREDFAVFCGSVSLVGVAMGNGADGYVPGVGNLLPRLAREAMDVFVSGDLAAGAVMQQRLDAVNSIYQKGRSIAEMFAALKGLLEIAGLCERRMLPPLLPVGDDEMEILRARMREFEALP